ncbi:hypothetical protein BLNAU_9366 [Blattamonas nauphoetae]|uniref:Uncharacterized protein n=1 Tax=Blattamonas nauphoetae TaxID=2049346 RepID=A0ABQ9XW18_9EUKA|nr:hypothetical protein BLNAU_9366 [Blattamonas nauphoetae]
MVWFAGTIVILSRQSRSMIVTLSHTDHRPRLFGTTEEPKCFFIHPNHSLVLLPLETVDDTVPASHRPSSTDLVESEKPKGMTLQSKPFSTLARCSSERLDLQRKGGKWDMNVLSCGLESWLCVMIRSEHCRLGVCGVKGGRGTDEQNNTPRQSPSSRRAVRTLWRSAASVLANLEVADRSGDFEWIRQRSFEFSAARIATIRFFIFNTAHSEHPLHTRLLRRHCLLFVFHGCRLTHCMLCLFDHRSLTNDAIEKCRAMELRSLLVDRRQSALQSAFREAFSLPEGEEKDHLEFNPTRPNIVPILILRSLRRVLRLSRCALNCRSTCPHAGSVEVAVVVG